MLTPAERKLFSDYEARRELAEVGITGAVFCRECSTEVEDDDAVVLEGEAMCADCAFGRALKLRADAEAFDELATHDRLEVLELLETQAHLERQTMLDRMKRGVTP